MFITFIHNAVVCFTAKSTFRRVRSTRMFKFCQAPPCVDGAHPDENKRRSLGLCDVQVNINMMNEKKHAIHTDYLVDFVVSFA